MEWNKFTASEKEYPEELVLKSIEGFSKATSNLLEIQIIPVDEMLGNLRVDFEFKVILMSNSVKNYRFEIFHFGYNVELFPVHLLIEESIFEQIVKRKMKRRETLPAKTEKNLNGILDVIFNSNRFKEVVAGLMKISNKYSNK